MVERTFITTVISQYDTLSKVDGSMASGASSRGEEMKSRHFSSSPLTNHIHVDTTAHNHIGGQLPHSHVLSDGYYGGGGYGIGGWFGGGGRYYDGTGGGYYGGRYYGNRNEAGDHGLTKCHSRITGVFIRIGSNRIVLKWDKSNEKNLLKIWVRPKGLFSFRPKPKFGT